MINLSSLAALLRTLRVGDGGINGPAAVVSRVVPVTRVASDDDAEVAAATLRQQPFARTARAPLLGEADQDGATARAPGRQPASVRVAVGAAAAHPVHAPRGTGLASAPIESTALEFTTIGTLLQSALRGSGTRSPHPPIVEASAPLTERSAGPATALARSLARSVSESGLFYESHVARWARNDYPHSALSREPQANWPAPIETSPAVQVGSPPLPDAAASLVGRQLDVLDLRQLVWTGELWPGQRATIELEEAPDQPGERDADSKERTASVWRTRLQLELPSLGRVSATVTLTAGCFDVVLDTDNAQSAARLRAARAELDEALQGSRIALHDFAVAVGSE